MTLTPKASAPSFGAANASSFQPFPFPNLPPELRVKVYKDLFSSSHNPGLVEVTGGSSNNMKGMSRYGTATCPLVASRQIYDKEISVFYGTYGPYATVISYVEDLTVAFSRNGLPHLRVPDIEQLQHRDIHIDIHHSHALLGLPDDRAECFVVSGMQNLYLLVSTINGLRSNFEYFTIPNG
ncbi:hypothetical protein TWF106_006465 [Orbilia oligospora]|uniref:Uncharacterized protein n=1 Tax=Orbilia oligospora TaxID=2813651 RepID=A0A7C8UP00_ORBOL|nr:hypothetical protein TWF106_006465 [Orbilia oligospora]